MPEDITEQRPFAAEVKFLLTPDQGDAARQWALRRRSCGRNRSHRRHAANRLLHAQLAPGNRSAIDVSCSTRLKSRCAPDDLVNTVNRLDGIQDVELVRDIPIED